jgi:hypothetical protein
MAEFRKQYKVSAVTAGTGITLVPVLGERTGGMASPDTIELTYVASPEEYRVVNKVIEVQLEVK